MNRILRYFVNQSFMVNLVTGFIILVGLYSVSSMKRDLIPAWEWPNIEVTAELPGASSQELEKFVTYPIEEVLQSLPGADSITSTSSNGNTRITVTYPFGSGTLDDELSQIQSLVRSVEHKLPGLVRNLRVEKQKNTESFLMMANLVGFDPQNPNHYAILTKYENGLREISGVTSVHLQVPEQSIFVEVNREKSNLLGISALDLGTQLRQKINFSPVGLYRGQNSETLVEINQSIESLDSLGQLPIRTSKSLKTVKLEDFAEIKFRPGRNESKSFLNGKPTAGLRASKSLNVDSISLNERVTAYNEKFNKDLPDGLKIEVLIDGAHFIQKQLTILKNNAWIGLLFVILTLTLLLNWRTSLMVALGVPIAYLGTLTILHSMGIAFDLFSVVGLILVLGMLVDDAIIISEKYNEKLELGLQPKDAAVSAARELIVPVTGAILTTIVAFLPILFVKSWVSIVLFSTPVIVISALLISLLESFLILPNHLSHFVKTAQVSRSMEIFEKLRSSFKIFAFQAIRFRYMVVFGSLLFFIGSGYVAVKKLKHEFNLRIDIESLAINATLKKASSLDDGHASIQPLESAIQGLTSSKDIENTVTKVGSLWRDGKELIGPQYAKITLYLDRNSDSPKEMKERLKTQLKPLIEEYKDQFEELSIDEELATKTENTKPIVKLKVQGRDEISFVKLKREIEKELQSEKNSYILTELVEDTGLQDVWRFEPDQEALLRQGLSVGEVANQVRSLFYPDEIGEVRFKGQSQKIYLESSLENARFEDLSSIPLMNGIGETIPTKFIGEWKKGSVQKFISHTNLKRSLDVDFKFDEAKGNKIQALSDLNKLTEKFEKKYPTLTFEVEDASKEEAAAQDWSLKVALICIVTVLFILALTLNSLTLPILAAVPMPFGLCAIILALWLHDIPLGIMAIIGLVGTIGVCVNASLIMVDEVNRLSLFHGSWSFETIVEGSSRRLRAIVITIMTTLAGVAPMAYGIGGDSSFLQPLAFSIFWGLSTATLVTLLFMPAFMAIYLDLTKIRNLKLSMATKAFRSSPLKRKPKATECGPKPERPVQQDTTV